MDGDNESEYFLVLQNQVAQSCEGQGDMPPLPNLQLPAIRTPSRRTPRTTTTVGSPSTRTLLEQQQNQVNFYRI